jgi:fucose permease
MDLIEVPRPAQSRSQCRNKDDISMTDLTSSGTQDQLEQQDHSISPVVAHAQEPLTLHIALKLTSAAFAFFVAGVNDGSLGALLPYVLRGYRISTGSVAILYGTAFAGWVVAALIGGYVRAYVGSGGALVLGASSQLVAYALRVWVCLAYTD